MCYKIKLAKLVKTFTKHNDSSRVAAKQANKKQTRRHRNWGTFRQKNKKTYQQIHTQADLQCTQRGKHNIKNEVLGPAVIEINKY